MCLLMSLEFRHGREGLPTAVYLAHERTLVRVDSAHVQSEVALARKGLGTPSPHPSPPLLPLPRAGIPPLRQVFVLDVQIQPLHITHSH